MSCCCSGCRNSACRLENQQAAALSSRAAVASSTCAAQRLALHVLSDGGNIFCVRVKLRQGVRFCFLFYLSPCPELLLLRGQIVSVRVGCCCERLRSSESGRCRYSAKVGAAAGQPSLCTRMGARQAASFLCGNVAICSRKAVAAAPLQQLGSEQWSNLCLAAQVFRTR